MAEQSKSKKGEGGDIQEGVVSAVYQGKYNVMVDDREWVCSLRGRRNWKEQPVVGDRVTYALLPDGSGAIETVLPRRNALMRRVADRGRRAKQGQVLAANVDQIIIVAALLDPPFRSGLVERFLVAAALADLRPLLCITKMDLPGDEFFEEVTAPYKALGVEIVSTSINHPKLLAQLATRLVGYTSVLVGHSGVGKTSLLNALEGRNMAVGELGEGQVTRGRHTTTTARLITLKAGGFAIDSPGVREFGLHGLTRVELAAYYPDFQPYLTGCGFRDCLHKGEPNCRIAEAVEKEQITIERYESYLILLEELEE